jgi:ribonucleotide reductase beta subunit family protein with ferritin-like domain
MGMNEEHMVQYVHFIADHMLTAISMPRLYNESNPFPWMDMISLQDKTNFFEKRVSAYSKANVGEQASKATVALKFDEEF